MKKEKITLIKPKKKEEKNYKLLGSIILLIVGIILLTNSNQAVICVCYCIGALIGIFGIYHFIQYYKMKKEFNVENNFNLISGVVSIFIGIILIILASAIEAFLRFIIGIILIINGIKKIKDSIDFQSYITLTIGIVEVAIGLYTILAENIIIAIVGFLLIVSSMIDIIKSLKDQKNKVS